MAGETVYCLGVVPARGGSKGLPNKNLALVGGKSLVRLAVEAAIASHACSRIICSTDSDRIATEAIRSGADVPFRRPAELAGDTASSLDVLLHAVHEIEGQRGKPVDLVCLLEPTTPLRTPGDIRAAVQMLLAAGDRADSVVSLCQVTDAHPAWLRKLEDGHVKPYFPQMAEPTRRQDLDRHPTPYRRNGAIYVTRRDVLVNQRSIYGQNCLGYVMPAERSVNIDHEMDLMFARAAWNHLYGCHGRNAFQPKASDN